MFTFSAMDLLVHNTMKNAAKCDKSCDLQDWNMNCLNVWYLFYSFEWERYFFEKSFFLFILTDKLFIRPISLMKYQFILLLKLFIIIL